MPLRKRATSVADGTTPDRDVADVDEPLALAEAEAAAAEAEAKAARARAQAIRLRQQPGPAPTVDAPGAAEVADDPVDDTPLDESPDELADGDATSAPPKSTRAFWRPLRWIAATLMVLAIAASITVSVLMVRHHHDVQARQQRAAEYIAAGRQGVVTVMSLNFNTIDNDIKRILDNSTGEFKKDFQDKVKDFKKVALDSKVITEATSTAAGLESMTDHDAVVLVAARTKVTNSAGALQEPRSWRLVVDLVRDGDQIKISKVDFAP